MTSNEDELSAAQLGLPFFSLTYMCVYTVRDKRRQISTTLSRSYIVFALGNMDLF